MSRKNNKQTIRTMLTNKYFWAALILFRGVLWIMGVTKGMGSEWAWYWISLYLSLLTLLLLGVGVLLVLVVFQIPIKE